MWYINSVVVTNETGNNGITGRRMLLARFRDQTFNWFLLSRKYIGVALLPLLSVLPGETNQNKLNGTKCSKQCPSLSSGLVEHFYSAVVPVRRVKDYPAWLFITLPEIFTCARHSVLLSLNFLSSLWTVVSRFQWTELKMVVDKTRNMEHSGTFRNIQEHRIIMIIMRKICKIKFSKTEKTSNLEAAKLKLHKSYHFMIIL